MISYYYWEINFLSPGYPESISQIPSGPWIMLLGHLCLYMQNPSGPESSWGAESRRQQTSQFVTEASHGQKGLELFNYKLLFIIRLIYTIWFMCSISYSDEHTNKILSLFYNCCEVIEIKDQTSA